MAEKSLKVTQIRSVIGFPDDQRRTLRALGLGRINKSIEQVDNPAVRGMIFKVKHLVKVEDIVSTDTSAEDVKVDDTKVDDTKVEEI